MWLLLLACASPPEPVVASAPAPKPAPEPIWTLTGRASSEGIDTPSLPGGGAVLGEKCVTINEALRGDGPPCFVEEWTAERPLRVERSGAALRFDGAPGRTTWSQILGPLAACLGDPLALPPAGDPGGTRALVDGRWVLTFSGANRCGLGGTLVLDATRNHAKWAAVTVQGKPWDQGGRDVARDIARAELRALVETRWRELDPYERAEALRALEEDPHPDAKALLARRR